MILYDMIDGILVIVVMNGYDIKNQNKIIAL